MAGVACLLDPSSKKTIIFPRNHQALDNPRHFHIRRSDAMLTEKNPTPVACPRGAARAVTAFQLFDLYDFFQAVTGDR